MAQRNTLEFIVKLTDEISPHVDKVVKSLHKIEKSFDGVSKQGINSVLGKTSRQGGRVGGGSSDIGGMSSLSFNKHLSYVKGGFDLLARTGEDALFMLKNSFIDVTREGMKFEYGISKVNSALGGLSKTNLDALSQSVLDIANNSIFTAEQVNEAYLTLARAGKFLDAEGKQVTASVRDMYAKMAIDIAQASSVTVEKGADMMASVSSLWQLNEKDIGGAFDVMANLATKANTTMSKLTESFVKATPSARAVGLSFKETASLLALLHDSGIRASSAGTQLGSALGTLFTKLKDKNVLAEMAGKGVNLSELGKTIDLQKEKILDFEGMLKALQPALGKLTEGNELFGKVGNKSLGIVLSNISKLKTLTNEAENSMGALKTQVDIMGNTLNAVFGGIQSKIQSLKITIFEETNLGKFLSETGNHIGKLLLTITDKVKDNKETIQEALAPLFDELNKLIDKTAEWVKNLTAEDIKNMITSVGDFVKSVYHFFVGIKDTLDYLSNHPIIKAIAEIIAGIALLAPVISGIITIGEALISIFEVVGTVVGVIVGAIGAVPALIIAAVAGLIAIVAMWPYQIEAFITNIAAFLLKSIIGVFQLIVNNPFFQPLNWLLKKIFGLDLTGSVNDLQSSIKFVNADELKKRDEAMKFLANPKNWDPPERKQSEIETRVKQEMSGYGRITPIKPTPAIEATGDA